MSLSPAVWVAVENRRPGLVSLLLHRSSPRLDLSPPSPSPSTLLHLATRHAGYISGQETAIMLVNAGLPPNTLDRWATPAFPFLAKLNPPNSIP